MERQPLLEQAESSPKDISNEFLTMETFDFLDFLRTQRKESSLSITIDWQGVNSARRLKAFVEGGELGQKRTATIRATEEQYRQELNVFASGVKWEKIEK